MLKINRSPLDERFILLMSPIKMQTCSGLEISEKLTDVRGVFCKDTGTFCVFGETKAA